MLIKLTEFDGDPIIINSTEILFVRPSNNVEGANTIVRTKIPPNDDFDTIFYVKETIDEILNKIASNPLF